MKHQLLIGFLLLFLAGCAPLTASVAPTSPPSPSPQLVTPSPLPMQASPTPLMPLAATPTPFSRLQFTPPAVPSPLPFLQTAQSPYDANPILTRTLLRSARVEMQGNPPRPTLVAQGELQSSCQVLRLSLLGPDPLNRILIAASAGTGPATDCTPGAYPVEQTLQIGPYPPGTYTLWLNDTQVGQVVFP